MTERKLAKVISADIADIYNGMLGLNVHFKYENGFHQNLSGYILDAALVIRFMGAIGVDALSKAAGKSCWVTSSHDKIHRIEPLHADEGRALDIEEWQAWVEANGPKCSYGSMAGW